MGRIYLTIVVSLAITVGAYGDYTLTPEVGGQSSTIVHRGDIASVELVLTSDANDFHYASLFTVEFSLPGLIYRGYAWAAPYQTASADDHSSPFGPGLSVTLDANTFVNIPDPGTVDIWFENMVPIGTDQNPIDNPFTTGLMTVFFLEVPIGFAPGPVTITAIPDTFDDGVGAVSTVGATFKLNIEIPGDADLNKYVDDDDLSLLLANWNTGTTWGQGDFSVDGGVDDDDLSLLLANWNEGTPPPPPLAGGEIPEPATLILMGLIAPALIRRVRR